MVNSHWLKEFPAIDNIDTYNPDPVVYKLHRTLDVFAAGLLPNDDYTFDHLLHLIDSLIKRQNGPDEYIIWGGNWAVIPTNVSAPSDVRVDCIFFPSYIAVSILTLFWYRYPQHAENIEGFFSTLHEGLHFIAARQLFGHGLEGDEQRDEAIRILLKGKVHHYLIDHLEICQKCEGLYMALVKFKTEYLREVAPRFEHMELIRELDAFANIVLQETPYFSWSPGSTDSEIILEAPYTVSPDSEVFTKDIVMDVAARTGCTAVIGKVSPQDKRYTGKLDAANEDTVFDYNQLIKEIVEHKNNAGGQERNNKSILHLIIRGMADRDGIDVEISTRNGQSCNDTILTDITDRLRWNLEGYSHRAYAISVNNMFGGGSKYLDYFKDGHPGRPDLPGFGLNHNVLEIRLSRSVRNLIPAKVKDALVKIINLVRERNYA